MNAIISLSLVLWKDRRKNELFLADGQVEKSVSELPGELWIEGTKEGEAEREISICCEILDGVKVISTSSAGLTVTPILISYKSGSAYKNEPEFAIEQSNNSPWLASGIAPRTQPASNIWVYGSVFRKNIIGTVKQIQVMKNTTANGIAASIVNSAGTTFRTFTHDHAPPNSGKWLVDAKNLVDFPYYEFDAPEQVGELLNFRIGDDPKFPLFAVIPGDYQYTELDLTWSFKDYAVWVFPDGSAYPLGRTEWDIRWAGRFGTNLAVLQPPMYWWTPNAFNSNNTSVVFERNNGEPALNLPLAKLGLDQFR